jgi:hypothetical protein
MTPKEKAEELVLKYLKVKTHQMFNGWWHKMTAKECALIAVDEMIDLVKHIDVDSEDYWNEVKQEIINL